VEVEEGDKQGFAGVISPRRVGGNGGKDVSKLFRMANCLPLAGTN
jgi:hypothetical protein